jgi:hypothetical protein
VSSKWPNVQSIRTDGVRTDPSEMGTNTMQLDMRRTALRARETAGSRVIQASKYGLRGDLRPGAGWSPLVLLKTAIGKPIEGSNPSPSALSEAYSPATTGTVSRCLGHFECP